MQFPWVSGCFILLIDKKPQRNYTKETAMGQNNHPVLSFARISGKKIEADFEGGNVTSDGGALFLREAEKKAGVIGRLCSAIRDRRDPRYVDHTLEDLVSQRVFQIACGYEDANDSNTLRRDPGIKPPVANCLLLGRIWPVNRR